MLIIAENMVDSSTDREENKTHEYEPLKYYTAGGSLKKKYSGISLWKVIINC